MNYTIIIIFIIYFLSGWIVFGRTFTKLIKGLKLYPSKFVRFARITGIASAWLLWPILEYRVIKTFREMTK
jgi:hypothetical protein